MRLYQVRLGYVMLGQVRFSYSQFRKHISGYDWLGHVRTG